MNQSPLYQALMLAEQSRIERVQKITNLLAKLPDDFDWTQLEEELKKV